MGDGRRGGGEGEERREEKWEMEGGGEERGRRGGGEGGRGRVEKWEMEEKGEVLSKATPKR